MSKEKLPFKKGDIVSINFPEIESNDLNLYIVDECLVKEQGLSYTIVLIHQYHNDGGCIGVILNNIDKVTINKLEKKIAILNEKREKIEEDILNTKEVLEYLSTRKE